MREFFEAFFEPIYRFKYYIYDTDIISGHSDKTVCYKNLPIDECKISFEKMKEIINDCDDENGCSIKIGDEFYYVQNIEIYQPTFKITVEIREKLEEILLELCRVRTINSARYYYFIGKIKSHSGTYGMAIQHKEDDEIIGCHHVWGGNAQEALLKLCIQLKDEIQNEVQALFVWHKHKEGENK